MKKFSPFFLALTLFAAGCGGKDETSSGCTKQNFSSGTLVISCIVKRSQQSSKCGQATTDTARNNEACQLGFDDQCAPARITNPREFKTSTLDTGKMVMVAKDTGKQLVLVEGTGSSSGNYLILKYADDPGTTSSITLPFCSDLGI